MKIRRLAVMCIFIMVLTVASGVMAAEEENVIVDIVSVNDTVEVPYGASEDEVVDILQNETEFIGEIEEVAEEDYPVIEFGEWIDIYDEYDPDEEEYPEGYDADARPNGYIFSAEALTPEGYEFDGDLSQVATNVNVHVEDIDNATGATVSVAAKEVEVEEKEELPETGGGFLPLLPGFGGIIAAGGVYLLLRNKK